MKNPEFKIFNVTEYGFVENHYAIVSATDEEMVRKSYCEYRKIQYNKPLKIEEVILSNGKIIDFCSEED